MNNGCAPLRVQLVLAIPAGQCIALPERAAISSIASRKYQQIIPTSHVLALCRAEVPFQDQALGALDCLQETMLIESLQVNASHQSIAEFCMKSWV